MQMLVDNENYSSISALLNVAIENQLSAEGKETMRKSETKTIGTESFSEELQNHNLQYEKAVTGSKVSGYVTLTDAFTKRPIKLNTNSEDRFVLKQDWKETEGLIIVYVWIMAGKKRFFMLTYDEAVNLLGREIETESWQKRKWYSLRHAGTKISFIRCFEKYENNWPIFQKK
jgi:hypothetical protein